jgi:hypothetical protein
MQGLGAAAAGQPPAEPWACEAADDDSESDESEQSSGPRSSRPSDASSSVIDEVDAAGCESVSDEEAYVSACSGSGDELHGTAAGQPTAPAVSGAAAQQPSFTERLQALGLRVRAPSAAPAPHELFEQWHGQGAARPRDAQARERAGAIDSRGPAAPTEADESPSPPTHGYSLPAPPAPLLQVAPPGPELEAQVAELMERDSEAGVALAMAIFRYLPTGALAAECERVFGRAPDMLDSTAATMVEQPPLTLTVAVSAGSAATPIVRRRRCFACDNDDDEIVTAADRAGSPCSARQLLDSLQHELTARDALVVREIANGADCEATHRGARWFMYRAFVAAKYGYLGRGVRVRIPDCVIAAIRSRYRAPHCACNLQSIVTCNRYVGHSDT